ncbi:MAG: hypothetical protein P1V81_16660 [Planctomycetota bacterium]|nr:hypothetical protein [Planctomycetota bacterium]
MEFQTDPKRVGGARIVHTALGVSTTYACTRISGSYLATISKSAFTAVPDCEVKAYVWAVGTDTTDLDEALFSLDISLAFPQ